MKTVSVVIVAAGNSSRMGTDKQQILLAGKPVWLHAVITFGKMPQVKEIVVVTKQTEIPRMQQQLLDYAPALAQKEILRFAVGGATRMDSVSNGIAACKEVTDCYAIHDGARPLITEAEIVAALDAMEQYSAVSMGVYVKDTIKQVDADRTVLATPDRASLMLTQTPQIFERALYQKALAAAKEKNLSPTDDCQLIESYGVSVHMVLGSYQNIKITTPEDIPMAQAMLQSPQIPDIRVGHGYDVHRFAKERKLILGGVTVPYEMGLLGHSDADVLVHAIMDALLGAAALGDIGQHFPDTDPAYAGADSLKLLEAVLSLLRQENFTISNIDATVVAQKPKLAAYLPQMREKIAQVCALPLDRVNLKATTEEKLGFTGRLEGISAHAVCTLIKN